MVCELGEWREEVVWMVNVECRCLARLDYARGIRNLGRQVNSFVAGGRLPTAAVSGQAWINDNGLGPSVRRFDADDDNLTDESYATNSILE
jgi:hypothetical protein